MTEKTELLDTRGLLCPLPVLKARKHLKSLAAGDILHLMADDPAAIIDVPHYCNESGHIFLDMTEAADHQLYRIQKKA